MNILMRTVFGFTFGKKTFVFLVTIIVYFATAFSAFTYRLGIAFAYDGIRSGEYFAYTFGGSSEGPLTDGEFEKYFEKYGISGVSLYPADGELTIVVEEETTFCLSYYCVTDEQSLNQLQSDDSYFSVEDVRAQNKLAVVSVTLAEQLEKGVGDVISVNGANYRIVAVDDVALTFGSQAGDLVLICSDELALGAKNVYKTVYLEKDIPRFRLKSIADSLGVQSITEKDMGFAVWFTILSIAVCALFAADVAVLFTSFVRANDKFYALFKILGIKQWLLACVAALPCIVFSAAGAVLGICADLLISEFTSLLGEKVYLGVTGGAIVFLINVACAFIGAAIACATYAVRMPADSLGRTQ